MPSNPDEVANLPDADDPDAAYVDGEVLTTAELANVDAVVAQREAVAAIADPVERAEAARWYQAALAGYPEPDEQWGPLRWVR